MAEKTPEENTDNSPDTSTNKSSEAGADEKSAADSASTDVINLDDIDSMIAEEDPEFEKNMEEIQEGSSEIEVPENADEHEVGEESTVVLSFDEKYPRLHKILTPVRLIVKPFKILAKPFYRFKDKLLILKVRLKNKVYAFTRSFITFVKEDVPSTLKKSIMKFKQIVLVFKSTIQSFIKLPLKIKLIIFMFVVMISGTLFFALQTTKGIWIPFLRNDTVVDLISKGKPVYKFDSEGEWQHFHTVFPQPEYTVKLKKIVANLMRRNKNENPMIAIELYLNLNSKEVAVEVMDRENQLRDTIQRVIEDMTYAEITDNAGIFRMKNEIKNQLNQVLNMGRVKDVFINTIVTIPNASY